jgi:hypothetical protein
MKNSKALHNFIIELIILTGAIIGPYTYAQSDYGTPNNPNNMQSGQEEPSVKARAEHEVNTLPSGAIIIPKKKRIQKPTPKVPPPLFPSTGTPE